MSFRSEADGVTVVTCDGVLEEARDGTELTSGSSVEPWVAVGLAEPTDTGFSSALHPDRGTDARARATPQDTTSRPTNIPTPIALAKRKKVTLSRQTSNPGVTLSG
jgi:hypothetical protein